MSESFDPNGRLILVRVLLSGSSGTHQFRFGLDTGSTRTAVAGHVLHLLGYREPPVTERRVARTGSGEIRAGLVTISRLVSLRQVRTSLPVLWLPLAPGTMIDGLIGLDFLRGLILWMDFKHGRISLRPPRKWWQFWR